jgi:CheY-like chemotaxis protein
LRPSAITLDVMMPDVDGWSVLTALRQDAELADIPVIMITIVDEHRRGIALGAAGYLTKPIDRERLSAVLRRCLPGRAARPVLIVEDDAATRELLRRPLEQEGWTVAEAGNGRAALERLEADRPGLILLDLMMPELDGFEFVEEVRKRGSLRGIPVVVVTAKDLPPEDHRRLNGSVEMIVRKGEHGGEELLAEVRERVAAWLRRPAAARA